MVLWDWCHSQIGGERLGRLDVTRKLQATRERVACFVGRRKFEPALRLPLPARGSKSARRSWSTSARRSFHSLPRSAWGRACGNSASPDRISIGGELKRRDCEELSRDCQGAVVSPCESPLPDSHGSKTSQPRSLGTRASHSRDWWGVVTPFLRPPRNPG